MQLGSIFRAANPYLGILAVLVLLVTLLATIFFTWFELQWTAFLAGMLMAAVLAMVGRASRAERASARTTERLGVLRQKLEQETGERARTEQTLAAYREAVARTEDLPVMLAYVDADQRVRYHNRAFGQGLKLPEGPIIGRHWREVLGTEEYGQVEDGVKQALSGRLVRFERTRRMPDRSLLRLVIQYVPFLAEGGSARGFYALATDITSSAHAPGAAAAVATTQAHHSGEQRAYTESLARQLTGSSNLADRLVAALNDDEFCLYSQAIIPVVPNASGRGFHEVLIRLKEEERNLMPPGAFLPLAEEHGLMPQIDRWVVNRLLDWVGKDAVRRNGLYSINVSVPTLSDAAFPAFVCEALRERGLGGGLLCFEFAESDAAARQADVENLVARVAQAGCRFALSGFGHTEVSFALVKAIRAHFLKIDGNIVLNMLRDRIALAKVKAIAQVARGTNLSTIAELVEDARTLDALREVGVDFAQGFAVSRPRPLEETQFSAPGAPC